MLGAPTDNMRGLYQGPQTMRNCQLCEQEVTQRWEIQANALTPLETSTTYHNAAAKHIQNSLQGNRDNNSAVATAFLGRQLTSADSSIRTTVRKHQTPSKNYDRAPINRRYDPL